MLSITILCQDVKFFGEDITFRLDKEYFIVDGIYWFFNDTDKPVEKIIFYPFPADSGSGEVDSISIYNLSEQREEIALQTNDNGLKYILVMPPGDTIIYRIGYRQRFRNRCVKYILTTTEEWDRPLDWAKYKLIVNDNTELNMFSYEPDRLYKIENEKIFYWEKRNFQPEYDFEICLKLSE